MNTPADVTRIAREYVGTPFFTDGRLKGKAIDCIGLPICVSWDLGWKGPHCCDYRLLEPDDALVKGTNAFGFTPLPAITGGALLCVRLGSTRRRVDHFAILTTDNTIIHANDRVGKVVEHVFDESWKSRVTSVWALPTVSY